MNVDNRAGIGMAIDHLAELGHRRFGFIGESPHGDVQERSAAFVDRLTELGMPHDRSTSWPPSTDPGAGADAFRRLMSLPSPPTAVVTATDNLAIGVLHAAHAMRVAIPEQVSVVGFDDIPLAAYAAPPLTTVHNPVAEMASLAVDLAIDRPPPERAHAILARPGLRRAGDDTEPRHGSMSRARAYVVGVDFGTLSGRAVVVRVADGAEVGSAVHEFRHGVLERRLDVNGPSGPELPPDWALQVPHDYVEVLQHAVPEAVRASGIDPGDVIGIGTDFTACTVLPVLDDGTPLCEVPELADRPHAYVKLWKHHAAQPHADRINALAAERGEPWLARYGGKISSEWEFAKGLQLLEEDAGHLWAHRSLGRGRRLDRLATHRGVRPQRLHGGLQGDPPGRDLPIGGLPRRTRPRVRRLRGRQGRATDRPAR